MEGLEEKLERANDFTSLNNANKCSWRNFSKGVTPILAEFRQLVRSVSKTI
jgi:hypothetical protein